MNITRPSRLSCVIKRALQIKNNISSNLYFSHLNTNITKDGKSRESNDALKYKQALLDEPQSRVDDKIIEENNYNLLKKLIENAETLEEAISIQQLGTMWKKTGFSYDVRLENTTDDI